MANPSGTTENLTKFQPKWKHGKTQTIRVPIALAEQLLTLARKLDDNNANDSLDTGSSGQLTELYERNGKLTRQCEELQAESSRLQESLDTAEDTIADLKNELANLSSTQAANLAVSSELEQLKAQLAELRAQLSSQNAQTVSAIVELPDAADLLNQLKAKRKKSKTDLQDVEAILEMMPEQSPPKLPDLYAARDRLFEMPSLGGWKFQGQKERDRLFAFSDAFIDQASRLNQDYPLIERLKSDIKQATERCEGYSRQLREKIEIIRKLEVKLGQRKY